MLRMVSDVPNKAFPHHSDSLRTLIFPIHPP